MTCVKPDCRLQGDSRPVPTVQRRLSPTCTAVCLQWKRSTARPLSRTLASFCTRHPPWSPRRRPQSVYDRLRFPSGSRSIGGRPAAFEPTRVPASPRRSAAARSASLRRPTRGTPRSRPTTRRGRVLEHSRCRTPPCLSAGAHGEPSGCIRLTVRRWVASSYCARGTSAGVYDEPWISFVAQCNSEILLIEIGPEDALNSQPSQ